MLMQLANSSLRLLNSFVRLVIRSCTQSVKKNCPEDEWDSMSNKHNPILLPGKDKLLKQPLLLNGSCVNDLSGKFPKPKRAQLFELNACRPIDGFNIFFCAHRYCNEPGYRVIKYFISTVTAIA